MYRFFFVEGTDTASTASAQRRQSQPFQALHDVLTFDTPSFVSVLDEAFEDSFLNNALENEQEEETESTVHHGLGAAGSATMTRQYIIRIMLDVLAAPTYDAVDTIYLDMFIARNLPKYPQYILLSGSTLQEIVQRLCHFPEVEMRDDAQLSIEYLLSTYYPANISLLVPDLKSARLFRVLRTVYRQERQFGEYIGTYFEGEGYSEGIFDAMSECLGSTSVLSPCQRKEVVDVIKSHVVQLVALNVEQTAQTLDHVEHGMHGFVLRTLEDNQPTQFRYLETLLERTEDRGWPKHRNSDLVELYIRLMCRFRPHHVKEYLEGHTNLDLRVEEVLPFIEDQGIVDAAVVLLRGATDRLLQHVETLKSALSSTLQNAAATPDAQATAETVTNLVESIRKYTYLGIWLCRSHMPASGWTKTGSNGATSNKEELSFAEQMWLDLVNVTVSIARDTSIKDGKSLEVSAMEGIISSIRGVIQEVFTALLSTTAVAQQGAQDGARVSFLRILQSFLSHAAKTAPSLAELRAVLATIFSAYAYEELLLRLANSLLEKDVFVHVEDIGKLRRQGWRPKGQVCEICRRRIWGPGLGTHVWGRWLHKESMRSHKRAHAQHEGPVDDDHTSRDKGKRAAEPLTAVQAMEEAGNEELGRIVVFSCRHIYHQKCMLSSQGSDQDAPQREMLVCPTCA